MHDMLEALPPLDTLPPLDELPPLEASTNTFLLTEETFDTLLASAVAAEPDSTEAAQALVALVREKLENGEVDTAIQQVMALGAAACMHPHLEDLANELGEEVMGRTQDQNEHEHPHHENHDHKANKKGKRRQHASVSIAELLRKYLFTPKASGQK